MQQCKHYALARGQPDENKMPFAHLMVVWEETARLRIMLGATGWTFKGWYQQQRCWQSNNARQGGVLASPVSNAHSLKLPFD